MSSLPCWQPLMLPMTAFLCAIAGFLALMGPVDALASWRQLSLAGDLQQTDVLRKDLHDPFPEDTVMNHIYLPVLSAVLAMGKGNAPEAVENLQVATIGEWPW